MDFDEELIFHGAQDSFFFPAPWGSVGGAVDEPYPELPAGPEQPLINESRAVVDICGPRDAAGGQRGFQRCGQSDGVLGEPEPVTHRQPAVVVQESEQIDLPAGDPRSM